MTGQIHTLDWGMLVKQQYDVMSSWPRDIREKAETAIERGMQHLRSKRGDVRVVSRTSCCTKVAEGNYQLHLRVNVEVAA